MSAAVRIRLLGGFELYHGELRIAGITPRQQALLAYLVVKPNIPQSRQRIAFALWPESSDTQARTNLRTAFHRLRAVLPAVEQVLGTDSQSLWWRTDAPVSIDLLTFFDALEALERADQQRDD